MIIHIIIVTRQHGWVAMAGGGFAGFHAERVSGGVGHEVRCVAGEEKRRSASSVLFPVGVLSLSSSAYPPPFGIIYAAHGRRMPFELGYTRMWARYIRFPIPTPCRPAHHEHTAALVVVLWAHIDTEHQQMQT